MTRPYHPDGTIPEDDRVVFVFGSNLSGIHGGGAARVARERFGAVMGVSYGPTGRAWAIPTKDADVRHALPLGLIRARVDMFLDWAHDHPTTQFFVTRIGCGLAGYMDDQIAPMFKDAPANCSMPEPWRIFLGEQHENQNQ